VCIFTISSVDTELQCRLNAAGINESTGSTDAHDEWALLTLQCPPIAGAMGQMAEQSMAALLPDSAW
jgi:hypothetical protein